MNSEEEDYRSEEVIQFEENFKYQPTMMMQALKSLKTTVRDMGKVADARDE